MLHSYHPFAKSRFLFRPRTSSVERGALPIMSRGSRNL
jgi:hypothetical protein